MEYGLVMSLEKHDLLHELPEHKDSIHELKTHDAHFAKLFAEYHEVDKEVHRIEEQIETPSDEYTHDVKAHRLELKDEMYQMILAHEGGE